MLEENIQEKKYSLFKKEFISKSNHIDSDNLDILLSKKSKLLISNQNNLSHIEVKISSIKNILFKGQLESNKYLLFSFFKYYKKDLYDENEKIFVNENRNGKNEDSILLNGNMQNKYLEINSRENIFDSESNLLNNKVNIITNFENSKNNFIIFNNIKINVYYLAYIYLLIFCCGLLKLIYFYDILTEISDRNLLCLNSLNKVFSFILIALLMITGIYGYKKFEINVYDDKICSNLTHLCIISPLISFAFSRISTNDNIPKILNTITNISSSFSSFFCVVILKELEKYNKV